MAIEDVADDSLVTRDSVTIKELREEFGREAVRRGLKYMRSLSEADEKFRDVSGDKMEKGYREAGVEGNVEPVANKWAKSMEENGLGIDGDE